MPFTTSLRVSVRIGAVNEHEECVRRLARKAGDDPGTLKWVAYQIYAGEGGRYLYTSQVENWAEFANRETTPEIARRLFGERSGNALLAQMNQGVESLQALVLQPRDDLSVPAEEPLDQPAPFILRSRIQIRPGQQEVCDELIHNVVEAVSKVGDERRFTTLQPLIGDVMGYSIVQRVGDPAELDRQLRVPDLLTEAFGTPDGGRILRTGRQAIERLQVDLAIHRPDLSNPA